ncbi:hypothetical protein [Yinghuangia aomiensis]|uniref:hypothetical protein n=1 Tax=Yinghuangia aomiensis TaxID=676205 RepID=UPI0031EADADA
MPNKPDISFTIQLCITNRPAGAHEAFAKVTWGSWDGVDSRARFDKVTVQVRAEKYDVSKASATGNLTARMNADDDGGWLGSAYSTLNSPGGWSADATVTYNVNDDGKGDMTWDVYGSPVIS